MVPSSHTRIKAFCRIIHNAGISVNIRTQFGSDINAACGQLAGDVIDRTKRTAMKRKFGEGIDVKAVN